MGSERGANVDETVLHEVRRLFAPEPETTTTARERAATVEPPLPEVGALLRWSARCLDARTIVEVGAAGGVTGLWLLPELPPRGVLTSIEPDPHAHGLASDAFDAADAGARIRSIMGEPTTVLDRLADGAYDLMILQARPAATPTLISHARRLLRVGGWLIVRGALRGAEHADLHAQALGELADDPAFTSVALPVDDGLVLATRVAPAADNEVSG